MRYTLISFLVLVVFSSGVHAVEPQDTTATVAAWNIYGLRTINDVREKNLARGIAAIDAEVVVLSEVKPDGVMAKLKGQLDRLGAEYRYEIRRQTADLNLAILYKEGVSVSNVRFVPGSDLGNEQLRKALAADVRIGKFDFLMIGVHLKSGRGEREQATRTRQCEKLAKFIANELGGAEKDVLILGDYNMIKDRDEANFRRLDRDFDLRYISSENQYPGFTHVTENGRGNFLDGFAVSQNHTGEYIEMSSRVVQMHKVLDKSLSSYRSSVTDHLPIVARFWITNDDD